MIEPRKVSWIFVGKVCIILLIAGLCNSKKMEIIIKIKQKRFGRINYSAVHLYG